MRETGVLIRAAGIAVAAAAMAVPAAAQEAGDADAGLAVFAESCAACHSIEAGEHGEGPSLAGIVGRPAGAAGGYDYSAQLAGAGFDWTGTRLEEYLRIPTQDHGGDQMFHAVDMELDGLDRAAIGDLLAFLTLLDD